jgi:hypothetical protein
MSQPRSPRPRVPPVPLLLLLLALLDLQTEIRLILDHFTLSSLLAAISNHLLATTTLVLLPSLWRLYQRESPS